MLETNPSSFYLTCNWHSWILSKPLQLQRLKAPLADPKHFNYFHWNFQCFFNFFFLVRTPATTCPLRSSPSMWLTIPPACLTTAGSKPSAALISELLSHKEGWLSQSYCLSYLDSTHTFQTDMLTIKCTLKDFSMYSLCYFFLSSTTAFLILWCSLTLSLFSFSLRDFVKMGPYNVRTRL